MGSSTVDPHAVENVVRLHDSCHRWVHANPERSYRLGWLVRHGQDPREVGVEHAWLDWTDSVPST
jgi:hypothetical protein